MRVDLARALILASGCSALLGGCTLSFEAPTDARARDLGARDGGRGDGAPDTGADGSVPIDGGTDGGADAADARTGDLGPGCSAERCPTAVCSAPMCRPDGTCGLMPSPMGTACEDGDPCTGFEACDGAGRCRAGTGCEDDGNPCTDEACTASGCTSAHRVDGSGCAIRGAPDGICCAGACVDPSTDPSHCGGCGSSCPTGLCATGTCATCRGDDECASPALTACVASARCELDGSCSYEVRANRCLIDGRCYSAGDRNPANVCELCAGGSTSWQRTDSCDDGEWCTVGDRCVVAGGIGRCIAGDARDCRDDNECTSDACNELADSCSHEPADGLPCSDGNPCTTNDRCAGGTCASQPTCPPAGPCEAVTCNPMTGACTTSFVPPGTACDDRDPCTQMDACVPDVAMGVFRCIGSPRCVDAICATASCDAMSGACTLSPRVAGFPCEPMAGCLGQCDGTGGCTDVVCG